MLSDFINTLAGLSGVLKLFGIDIGEIATTGFRFTADGLDSFAATWKGITGYIQQAAG